MKQSGLSYISVAVVDSMRPRRWHCALVSSSAPPTTLVVCFQIQGAKDPETARELHISYHNGDHYSSVRKIGDNLEAPANVKIKVKLIPMESGFWEH